ncbi:sporulation protein YqfD [Selenomonadales bacterium OttesenSCG-928-I06]|nr:sporulation protein YqfD [Selenomonadales bacterium OttesenSCG-928-I06]
MAFNINFLKGAVKIYLYGEMPERFINLCIVEKINLWGIEKEGEGLIAWISLQDFFKIRTLVRKSQVKVKVISFLGLPFFTKRIKKRKMLLIGGVLFILAIYILSSHIWFINIIGLKAIQEEQIKRIALENGIKIGAKQDEINIEAIEKDIMLKIPEVSWVSISLEGTKIIIEVVEKTMPVQEDKSPANIVAQKDAVIDEIIVLAGEPVIRKGDTVKRGDTLIIGTGAEESRAKGIVRGKVWYESYAESNLVKIDYEFTGNKRITGFLKIGDTKLDFNPFADRIFPEYDTKVISKALPLWRNSDFNVEITINVHYEKLSNKTFLGFEEAYNEAKTEALQTVQDFIPENAQILSNEIEVLQDKENEISNVVRIRISVETMEDIGEKVNIN